MSLTINSFKNMDFFKILEKLKELNPKFDYKSNTIVADEFKIKFVPFENVIVISSLKNGESIKFANKTLDCLSGLVSDDVLFNLMENYDIEELFKKKSINEELFENFKKLKNDSDTYVSKLMEKYDDGLTVEERNKIRDEIKNYNDLVELCNNSMIVKTGKTSVEYEYKKFRFGIIVSEPSAAMRLNKAFLLHVFVFNLQNNLLTKTYYITYEEAVNLGFEPESMKDIINSQIYKSMEYVKAFGISEEIKNYNLVEEINRLQSYHKKGIIYDYVYYHVIENLYYDKEEIIEESVNKKYLVIKENNLNEKRAIKEDIVNEVIDLLNTENGVDKFLSSAKFITSGTKFYNTLYQESDSDYYVQYNYKGCKIDIECDLLVYSIENLLITVSMDTKFINKLADLYYKDVIKLGFPEKEIIESIYKQIINTLNFWIKGIDEVRKNTRITEFLSNSKIMGFLYENKKHKDYKKVMKLISLFEYKDDELYEGINLSKKKEIELEKLEAKIKKQELYKKRIKNEVAKLLKTEEGIDKFLSSAKRVDLPPEERIYNPSSSEEVIYYVYKNVFLDLYTAFIVDESTNIYVSELYYDEFLVPYKGAIKLGFDKEKVIDGIYEEILDLLQYKQIDDEYYKLDKNERIKRVSSVFNNQDIMKFLNENKNHKDYEKVIDILKSADNITLYESDYSDSISERQNYLKILNEVKELFQTSDGIDKFLSSAKLVENNNKSYTLFLDNIKYIYKNTEIRINFINLSHKNIVFTYLRIECKNSMFFVDLYYKEAIRLGFDKQKIVDYIYMKLIDDIQHDSSSKSLNEFEKIKKISSILNNQEVINFLNDTKNNVLYEKLMNIIKSLNYKKATNIINSVDGKDVLYENKNNSKENNIPDEVVKLLNSKKGIDKFLSEAEFDYKTTTEVNYKYKNKTVSIKIELYNSTSDFDKVVLRVENVYYINPICLVYYKDAIRLGFRKKMIIDHLFEKFFKQYNWYRIYKYYKNNYYGQLINDKLIKFLNDNKTHKDYRKAMRIIKHPYRGEGTIYESKDEKSFSSYPSADYDQTRDVIELLSSKDGIDKFMSEAEILKRYNIANLYLYKNNIYEFQISPKYDNPTKINLNDFYSITGGILALPYTEIIKLGFDESIVVDMVYNSILANIELYKHSAELFNGEVVNFVLAHKNHKDYKPVKNYLEKAIASYGNELLESKDDETHEKETTDDILKELNEFNSFMESSFNGINKFLSKAKLLKSNEEKTIYQYKNGIYNLYICPWWYDYKMKNLFIIKIGYERYSENSELTYVGYFYMDYRNAIKLGLNKDKVIKTIYDKIYRFLDDLIIKHKKINFYNEHELNEIMKFLEMSIDYSKEYQEAYNKIKNYLTGKPSEEEIFFESKRK